MKADVDEFSGLIDNIRQKLRAGRYPNESAIREALVLPVLAALEWDTTDPYLVKREHPVRSSRVDYALFVRATHPEILVEVKAIGSILGGDKQLFEYAFHEGVPMTLLTDGQNWRFYLPAERGSYEERCVYSLDMLERGTDECRRILSRYLGQQRVASGKAIADARRDHESAARERTAAGAIPAAWAKLVADQDQSLVDLLAEQAEVLCGHKPTLEQVATFLATLQAGAQPGVPAARPVVLRPRPPASVAAGEDNAEAGPVRAALVIPQEVPKAPPNRRVRVVLDGKESVEKDAMAGLLSVIRHLAAKDPTFLERLSTRTRGRRRNHVARSPEEVHPRRPDMVGSATEIQPGWFIDTNISNHSKRKILEAACDVAGVRRGRAVDIPGLDD